MYIVSFDLSKTIYYTKLILYFIILNGYINIFYKLYMVLIGKLQMVISNCILNILLSNNSYNKVN